MKNDITVVNEAYGTCEGHRTDLYLELCCGGIGLSLQRREVQPALVLAEPMPVLRLPDILVNSLQNPAATGLCSLQQLQVRRGHYTHTHTHANDAFYDTLF